VDDADGGACCYLILFRRTTEDRYAEEVAEEEGVEEG